MRLGEKQEEFGEKLPKLLNHILSLGYKYRLKHLLRCEDCKVGHTNSLHKYGLAIDIVLFFGGRMIRGESPEECFHYNFIHDYWDSLGGAKRIRHDLGHFSLEWGGMR